MHKKFCWITAVVLLAAIPARSQAAFHLWEIQEIYTNSSGDLQFIEMFNTAGFDYFVKDQQIFVSNTDFTQTNTFKMPSNVPDSFNRHILLGTAGLQAAGGPAPDFIIPNGFLFAGGGTIDFFGQNGGSYTALPTNGTLSRDWNNGNNIANSPTNYAGVTGSVLPPAIPGDFDGDNDVDGADFVAWQTNFPKQTGGTLATGDADHDGDVDGADFVVWQTNFPYPSSAGVVPEPSAFALATSAGVSVVFLLRRRRALRCRLGV
jgi:hypothetical protein